MTPPSSPDAPSNRPFDPSAAASPDSGIFGLQNTPEDSSVVLIPVPFEVTTSYRRGTARGPVAILEASRQVELFDPVEGRPYEAGIALLDTDPQVIAWNEEGSRDALEVIAAGGLQDPDSPLAAACARVNRIGARLNEWVSETVTRWLGPDRLVGVVGGDHAVPFGSIQAHARWRPGLGVLHVDAHADLRCAYEGFDWSHASIMHNVVTRIPEVGKLVQVGIRDFSEEELEFIRRSEGRIQTFFDFELRRHKARGQSFEAWAQRVVEALPGEVYVSIDIDGLEPSFCPNTGTPVPGGLTFGELLTLLEVLVESGRRVLGFDLVEVAPGADGDEWDGNVGARVLYKLIGTALRSRRQGA